MSGLRNSFRILVLTGSILAGQCLGHAEEDLADRFNQQIRPFLRKHCIDCHGTTDPEAKLDLSHFRSMANVTAGHGIWKTVLDRLQAGEMPPPDADQPLPASRKAVIDWIIAMRSAEAQKHAGDPGPVLVRRLSNAEYNNSIRDLTGVDIRPTSNFPVDPANQSGFDNSGESLTLSPALLTRYLAAARSVAEHMVLTPGGIVFAPHPAVTETDRDKFCVKRIVQFYRRQPTDLAEYFYAAWKVRTAPDPDDPATIQQIAAKESVSPRYLKTVLDYLQEENGTGPANLVRSTWKAFPADPQKAGLVQVQSRALRDTVIRIRNRLRPRPPNLYIEGSHKGSQPFVLWKNRQYAAGRRTCDRSRLLTGSANERSSAEEKLLQVPPDPTTAAEFFRSLQEFCRVFPDEFYVSERGRDYVDSSRKQQHGERGRLLSAGFHSMMGYFRDDQPLYDLVLDPEQQQELDRLWTELDFVTSAPMRQYMGFLWFERTDSRFMRDAAFDFARPENRSALSSGNIQKLASIYLDKARKAGGGETELEAIRRYFTDINRQIRRVEQLRQQAEPIHLEAIIGLARRAWRHELNDEEASGLRKFYKQLRKEGLSHAEAIQDCFVSILVSPRFGFRLDLLARKPEVEPLPPTDLASRLSYFLWSSLPDENLLLLARDGKLQKRDVLEKQVFRMLADERVAGLAIEFGGNWLGFRRFEEHNSVDRKRFPGFTDELRRAMFLEPVHFLTDLFHRDGSILELLNAEHTFVNEALAKHYRMPDEIVRSTAGGRWVKVNHASRWGRGGLLPMAVFLTSNSPGLRTSPVKRGYWVVKRLFGERIPPPPPNVPELPQDESALGDLTLTEVLARHRKHTACAVCHDRIDGFGVVFEGYGPIGERRERDLGGRPVILTAHFPGGFRGTGVRGLLEYANAHRTEDFIDNFCRKLLSYALGRTLILSDDLLIDEMKRNLRQQDQRFSSLILTIVNSPQFLNRRGNGS